MFMKKLFGILLCGLALTAFTACGDDGTVNNGEINNKGLIEKSCDDFEEISGEQQEFKVTIKTDGEWKARLSQTKFVSLKEGSASGAEGESEIVMVFTENGSDAARSVTLSVTVGNNKSVTVCRVTQRSIFAKGTDAQVNREFTWRWMNQNYLWNEDLRAAVNSAPDYDKPYDEFLDYLLKSINTNTMDGYWYPSRTATKKEWVYYSNISRYAVGGSASVSSVTRAGKTQEMGFGAEIEPMMFDYSGNLYFSVLWVYPGSPAAQAGLKRGDFIGKINGSLITERNYEQLLIAFYYPNNGTKMTFSLCSYDFDKGAASYPEGSDKEVTTGYYFPTPVVYYRVFESSDASIKNKIAYLVYTSFDNAYDDDLRKAFYLFKEKNATDIILDLRYNGGGAVVSSQLLTSVIAGPSCADQVFMYYRYNDERMKSGGWDKNDYKSYNALKFDGGAANSYGFNFDNIYIIGTYDTASASELVINALHGIDRKITHVGLETNGKNVGMEVITTTQPLNGYMYSFAPISFQSYNAKGESDYDDGFVPDIKADFSNIVPHDWGVAYQNGDDGKIYYADYIGVCLDAILSASNPEAAKGRKVVGASGAYSNVRKLQSPRSVIRHRNMYVDYVAPEDK